MRAIVMILLLLAGLARAHQIDEITIDLQTQGRAWRAMLRLDAAYMLPEYRGDADIAPFDLAWLRTREPEEWQRIREETGRFLEESLRIGQGADRIRFPDFSTSPPSFVQEGFPEGPPEITVELSGTAGDDGLPVSWNETLGVVLIVRHGNEVFPLVSGETRRIPLQGRPPRHFGDWLRFGFHHILPAGLDHLLFILGIFLLKPQWKPLLAQSLTFTVAHSITLACAALGWFILPARWVESAIALSIAWIALENLWVRDVGPRRHVLIGFFGLVHGLGFARMLGDALPGAASPLGPLVAFNLGVEAGQLTVLGAALALTGWWKDEAFARLRVGGSIAIAIAGLVWALQRAC